MFYGNKPFWLELSDLTFDKRAVFYAGAIFSGSYSTDISGGYAEGNFPINLNPFQTVFLSRKALNKHAVLYSPLGDIVYEGRIENVASHRYGLTMNTLGYYSHANDLTSGLIYPESSPATSISEVVADHIALSTLWTKNYAFIIDTTEDVTPLDFSGEAKLIDAIEKVLTYGSDDNPPRKLFFQIWRDRIPHLVKEPSLDNYTYYLDLTKAKQSGSDPDAAVSMANVYNKIQVLFDTEGEGQDFTDWFEDAKSQAAYGVREGTINLGQSLIGIANDVGAMAIDRYKNPEQTLSINLPDKLCTKNYEDAPGYGIRGGDVVLLTGETSDLFYEDYQPGRAAAIVTHTTYDIGGRSISLNFGTRSPYFEMSLALLGYSSVSVT